MTWVKLDDSFSEHPKIASLSDSGLALWITSLAYCNRNLTDGFVPLQVGLGGLRYCDGNSQSVINELEMAGLWESIEGGWMVHDYGEYQLSRDVVLAERSSARERMKRVRSDNVRPNISRTSSEVPGTGTGGLEVGLVLSKQESNGFVLDNQAGFAGFWDAYPRRVGKRAARAAFDRAVERASAEQIIAGAERYRDDLNRDSQFTAHPTTWLNRDGWDDDPEPARGKAGVTDRLLSFADRLGER